MSCSDNKDLCLAPCDDYTGTNSLVFEQGCGEIWPPQAQKVILEISCAGCGCGMKFKIDGEYENPFFTPLYDAFDDQPGNAPEADTFFNQAGAITATVAVGPNVTCALPCGFRVCDYKLVAILPEGGRQTLRRGRVTVR